MPITVLKLGYSNPLTDIFGAHPLLGATLDLTDGATFTLTYPDGLELPPPPHTLVTAGNIRTQGERATRAIYRHNREVRVGLILGPMQTHNDLTLAIRQLLGWLNAPPSVPFSIQYQAPGASSPVYLDVVGASHNIPADESSWLRLQLEPVEIIFICRPGLRGDRIWLQNLAPNPGFEAPSGPGMTVFADSFANTQAYSVVSGSAPSVASNVMTLVNGTSLKFGSPAWGAIQTWQIRWQWVTGLSVTFDLHYTDAGNRLFVDYNAGATTIHIGLDSAFVFTAIAQQSWTPTNGNWYWWQITQFPTVPGDPPYIVATLYNDSGGAIGTQILRLAGAVPDGSTVPIVGQCAIECSGANLNVGGNFANVHTLALFGPGAWIFFATGGSAPVSGAWDQNSADTYPNGPVTSYGAARMDLPPAGTVSASWHLTFSGAPAGTPNMPVHAPGDTVAFSLWVRGHGLHATNAQVFVTIVEYNSSGTSLRGSGNLAQMTGSQLNDQWVQLSGTYTTGANCAYVDLNLTMSDTAVAGESANGILWLDNVQVWDVTSTGVAAGNMPYCELRFQQSPARLLVSGLLGDLPAPAFFAFGTYLSSWPTGSILNFAIGRRGQESSTARLLGAPNGYYGTALSPQAIAALDASSYGGYYAQASVGSSGWNPRCISLTPADAPGVYHLFGRFLTQQAVGNLGNVETRVVSQQKLNPWYGHTNGDDVLGAYDGPFLTPLSASNAWTVVDDGQFNIPALPAGPLSDPTQTYLTPHRISSGWTTPAAARRVRRAGRRSSR